MHKGGERKYLANDLDGLVVVRGRPGVQRSLQPVHHVVASSADLQNVSTKK
jgi:hypothetical protein